MFKYGYTETEIISIRHRLSQRTRPEGDCEVWFGGKKKGYGQIVVKGKNKRTHRLTWELERGPIPDGLGVLHTCDNRACRKLTHLFLGTAVVNNLDRDQKGRGSAGSREGHGHAKLTEQIVKAIRVSQDSAEVLAIRHAVTVETVRRVRRGEAWPDTPEGRKANRELRRYERSLAKENKARKASGFPALPRAPYGSRRCAV